jgi:acyl dehydratase
LKSSTLARGRCEQAEDAAVAGLYFEQFAVGQVIEHALRRTVTEADNTLFSVMTMNPQPLHLDAEFAAKSEFGQRLVNSLFTLGLMIGLSVGDTTLGTTIANLGMTDVTFPKPVFHGDTLRAVTKVLAVRESKSRPDAGLVEFEHTAVNQRGELVAVCKRTALMMKRPATTAQSETAA